MKVMTASDWDSIWENHSDDPTLKTRFLEQTRIASLITNCFPDGAKVLDLGSGDGELALKLKDAGHTATCVDISSVALEQAEEKGLETIQTDLQTIDFSKWQKDSYDAVVCSHLVDHLIEPQQVVKLALMVLKPDGFLAFSNYRTHIKQEDFDLERYPTCIAIDDEAILGLFQTTASGRIRLEKHCDGNMAMIFYGKPPPTPTLSLCLMAWNEEPFIRKCIESVPYDELIVGVDDDTSDNTYKIAKEYVDKAPMGGEIYYFPHMIPGTNSYNFSARRNEGFEKATCDWIIQIDAHEYMNPESMRIKEELAWAGEKEVFHVTMNRTDQQFHVPHLWTNNNKYCYIKAVHNILAKKNGESIDSWRRALMQGIQCYHEWTDEKADERAKQRNAGNIKGLLKEAEEDPESERPHFFIANAYLGIEDFDNAYKAYDDCLERAKDGQEELQYQCHLLQGKILIHQDKFEEARKKLLKLSALHAERCEHMVYAGDAYASEKDFRMAKTLYMASSHFRIPSSCMFVEKSLYSWWVMDRLFMVSYQLQEFKNAKAFLIKMIEELPRNIYEERLEETKARIKSLETNLQEKII